jgi:Ca2+-binding RTX toxin-like protein
VAVSRDGQSVFVASSDSASLSQFVRAASGALSFRACFDEVAGAPCATPAGVSLLDASEVAVSPGGDSVYVTTDDGISGFTRELPRCRGKKVTAFGRAGAETIRGTAGRDVIAGLGGRDTIKGLGGKDILCGGAGNDRLLGGKASDTLVGGKGRDRLLGAGGRDRLFGGKGRDRLLGGKGRDKLRGGPGRDRQRQ